MSGAFVCSASGADIGQLGLRRRPLAPPAGRSPGWPSRPPKARPSPSNVATFVDPACGSPTYSATIAWGDGTQTSGVITYNGTCGVGYNVLDSHTYAEEGAYTTTITVTGTDGFSGGGTGTATVNDAALTLSPLTVYFTAHKQVTAQVATLRYADPGGQASDYVVTIGWGDGGQSTGVVVAGQGGAFTVTGTHKYLKSGSDTITVMAKDVGGATASTHSPAGSLVVTGLTIHATHGVGFATNVRALSTPCAAVAVSRQPSSGATVRRPLAESPTTGPAPWYNVLSSHVYAAAGTYKILIIVKGAGGEGGTGKGTAIVS